MCFFCRTLFDRPPSKKSEPDGKSPVFTSQGGSPRGVREEGLGHHEVTGTGRRGAIWGRHGQAAAGGSRKPRPANKQKNGAHSRGRFCLSDDQASRRILSDNKGWLPPLHHIVGRVVTGLMDVDYGWGGSGNGPPTKTARKAWSQTATKCVICHPPRGKGGTAGFSACCGRGGLRVAPFSLPF